MCLSVSHSPLLTVVRSPSKSPSLFFQYASDISSDFELVNTTMLELIGESDISSDFELVNTTMLELIGESDISSDFELVNTTTLELIGETLHPNFGKLSPLSGVLQPLLLVSL